MGPSTLKEKLKETQNDKRFDLFAFLFFFFFLILLLIVKLHLTQQLPSLSNEQSIISFKCKTLYLCFQYFIVHNPNEKKKRVKKGINNNFLFFYSCLGNEIG